MSAVTSRLALPYPSATDPNNIPGDMQRLAQALDGIAVSYLQGAFASRPAAAVSGRFFEATDTQAVYYDTGAAWIQLNINAASLITTKGDLLVGTGAGVLSRLAAGANGQVLQAQSGATPGLQWATVLGQSLGLTGAVSATRFAGGTTSGAPTTGTFAKGDYVIAGDGHIWICSIAGTPGTWVDGGSASKGVPLGLTGAGSATRYAGGTTSGAPGSGTFALGDFVIGQDGSVSICTAAGTPGSWDTVDPTAIGNDLSNIKTALFGGAARTRAPMCALYTTADRSLAAGSDWFEDTQWSVGVDSDSIWQAGIQPSGGYMRVPITGRYDVEFAPLMGGTDIAKLACKIVLNGVSVQANSVASEVAYVPAGYSTGEPQSMRAILRDRVLTAGDKLYFSVWSSVVSTISRSYFGGLSTIAMLTWMGPY